MSILTIQRRLHERGRIRIGQKVPTSSGKERPEKLDRFRFTSQDADAIAEIAGQHGGAVEQWDAPTGKQWQVVTESTDIPVVVPPSDFGFSQFMEFWTGGGCKRRCDGVTELITGDACKCTDDEDPPCKPTTRLSVILPDLPGMGLWRLETHGWNAAAELQGTVEIIGQAMGQGRLLPARLRLQQRSSIVEHKGQPQTVRFAVPVLDVDVRFGELVAASSSAAALTDPSVGEIGPARFTPVPVAELAPGPQPSIAEQVQSVQEPQRRGRANGAQPIPSTGLKPRPAAEAEAEAPAERGTPEAPPFDPMTQQQSKALHALLRSKKGAVGPQRHAVLTEMLGREITSASEVSFSEAGRLIETLQELPNMQPAAEAS